MLIVDTDFGERIPGLILELPMHSIESPCCVYVVAHSIGGSSASQRLAKL